MRSLGNMEDNVFVYLLQVSSYICDRIWENRPYNVTIDISRNTDLKYWSRHGSPMLDCSHDGFAI